MKQSMSVYLIRPSDLPQYTLFYLVQAVGQLLEEMSDTWLELKHAVGPPFGKTPSETCVI